MYIPFNHKCSSYSGSELLFNINGSFPLHKGFFTVEKRFSNCLSSHVLITYFILAIKSDNTGFMNLTSLARIMLKNYLSQYRYFSANIAIKQTLSKRRLALMGAMLISLIHFTFNVTLNLWLNWPVCIRVDRKLFDFSPSGLLIIFCLWHNFC